MIEKCDGELDVRLCWAGTGGIVCLRWHQRRNLFESIVFDKGRAADEGKVFGPRIPDCGQEETAVDVDAESHCVLSIQIEGN